MNNTQYDTFKPKKFNGLIIFCLSVLYIILLHKIVALISYDPSKDDETIATFVMTMFILSIIGIAIAFIWFNKKTNGDYVVNKSLIIGSIISLLYTLLNNWDYVDDYAKIMMLVSSICFISYYAY